MVRKTQKYAAERDIQGQGLFCLSLERDRQQNSRPLDWSKISPSKISTSRITSKISTSRITSKISRRDQQEQDQQEQNQRKQHGEHLFNSFAINDVKVLARNGKQKR